MRIRVSSVLTAKRQANSNGTRVSDFKCLHFLTRKRCGVCSPKDLLPRLAQRTTGLLGGPNQYWSELITSPPLRLDKAW